MGKGYNRQVREKETQINVCEDAQPHRTKETWIKKTTERYQLTSTRLAKLLKSNSIKC